MPRESGRRRARCLMVLIIGADDESTQERDASAETEECFNAYRGEGAASTDIILPARICRHAYSFLPCAFCCVD